MYRTSIALMTLLLYAPSELSQTQTPSEPPAQVSSSAIRTNVQEVVLDMVFRDKKGKTIRDIKPEEIHISEDGADQKLTSFRLLEGGASGQSLRSRSPKANWVP